MITTRRSFLRSILALGAATTAAGLVLPEAIVEPRKRFWAVPRNAPVVERLWSPDIEYVAVMPPHGEFMFEVDAYRGATLAANPDGTVRIAHPDDQPIGIVTELVGDNQAWIRLGARDFDGADLFNVPAPSKGFSFSNMHEPKPLTRETLREAADAALAAMKRSLVQPQRPAPVSPRMLRELEAAVTRAWLGDTEDT